MYADWGATELDQHSRQVFNTRIVANKQDRVRPASGSLQGIGGFVVAEVQSLRPVERVVQRLVDSGVGTAEVAWRLRRSPRSVNQILKLSTRARTIAQPPVPPQVLRPLERRILAWRAQGASYAEIGARFRRSPAFIRRVEGVARAKIRNAEI
jgi:DNA-binding CsgD family transcriptional regulator